MGVEGEAMKRRLRRVMCCVGGCWAVGLVLAPLAPIAGAQPQPAAAPAGYHIVQAHFPAPPGTFDAGGQAACPTGTVAWGGGTGNDFQNGTINTSAFVATTGWHSRVNNNAGSTESFEVDAICAKKPKLYTSVSHLFDDPAGLQAHGSVTCPTGTVLLSGSVLSEGDTTNVYLTSAFPNGPHTYTAYQKNGSTMDEPFSVSVLCAQKPPGYAIVRVTQTASGGGGLVVPESYCRSGASVIGGGMQIATPRPLAIMSASLVGAGTTNAWLGVVQNESPSSVNVTASVICAS
jgi:hypothetical protein